MTRRARLTNTSLIVCLAVISAPLRADESGRATTASVRVDFAREVLPLLSEKCFECHGPGARKKNILRLDSRAGATRDLGGYRAIDPNAPENSEILVRINDPEDPMPPKRSGKVLTKTERALIESWVRQGGRYERHWAFVPPRKSAPPVTEPGSEGATESVIDAFVLARLQKEGTTFAPEADRSTIARRAALVLTGLPPEPDRLAAFLADDGPEAYERLVDDLLSSPRYGEHQARYWLDAVRYGDTHGLHYDNRRAMYPYRDWVVRAFNQNLPIDTFITWQLAGDLLPDPTLEQRVATGFVRMNPSTGENGVIPEEYQAKNSFDRTATLGTALLGVSLSCARCHSHKYDPISQTEYYRLLAFFNSTSEEPTDTNTYEYDPVVMAPRNQAVWDEWTPLEPELKTLLAKVETPVDTKALSRYARSRPRWTSSDWRISRAVAASGPAPTGESDWQMALPGVRRGNLPKPGEAVWVSFEVKARAEQILWMESSGAPGSQIFLNGTPVPSASIDERTVSARLELSRGAQRVRAKMLGTELPTTLAVQLNVAWRAMTRKRSWEKCTAQERLRMLAEPRGPLAHLSLQDQSLDVARRLAHAKRGFTPTLVAQELDTPRETRVLRRGEYDQPVGDPLQPGVPAVMGPFPERAPRNRLGLAQWLTSREHPLVSRVLINRVWQRVFGEGLVRTPEDFGRQGERPTHPELLDWLAVELVDSGWDLKHMLRLMVTSRTFRQCSARRDDVDDPENRLLARGPSYRLDAEVIRDLALWASGLLDPGMGGEGVKPYQPDGLWAALSHRESDTGRYERDRGPRLYRRSLYVYWKRTSPHPMMTLFDAPSREASCVRRSRTSTPLQSLALLSEPQRLEAARVLAERLLHAEREDSERLNLLFTLLASRRPFDWERRASDQLLRTLAARYAGAQKDALALLSVGDAPRDEALDPAEHAAWSQVVIAVLASDAALMLY